MCIMIYNIVWHKRGATSFSGKQHLYTRNISYFCLWYCTFTEDLSQRLKLLSLLVVSTDSHVHGTKWIPKVSSDRDKLRLHFVSEVRAKVRVEQGTREGETSELQEVEHN